MRIADMLKAIATWLESPNNEALLLADYDDASMKIVAENCVLAAALLKNAADEVSLVEPKEESKITSDSLQELAALAQAFDASGDPGLIKQASVLDELLMSIAAPPNFAELRKDREEQRILSLKEKYNNPTEALAKNNKIADVEKAIEQSGMAKQYKILEAPLSARNCPDHVGVQITRVGDGIWQCLLDNKVYDFKSGYELNNGAKVPGGDVSEQTQHLNTTNFHSMFNTRESRLGE